MRNRNCKKINIAVCDDDKSFTDELRMYIERRRSELLDIHIDVSVYHSGEAFLKDVDSGMMFHMIFMDIEMEAMNGIAIGHHFRRISECDDVVIIYISNYSSFSNDLLDVGNVRFVKKPYSKEKLDIAFNRGVTQALKDIARIPKHFVYTINKDRITIDINEIVYMKSAGKLIEIFSWNNIEKSIRFLDKFYSNIPEVVKRLPKERFLQCERSHIVNLTYVSQVWSTAFVLTDINSTQIPIGKTFREEAKGAFFHSRGQVSWLV